jgi:outer membrane protein assembly complex protein YaeT
LLVGGCREQGDIRIHSLKFEGVEQIRQSALAAALQTKKGSRLPWGKKTYFDRRSFEADLQRIEAFYKDRGFPDARVMSFDVKLNDAQDQVDITLHIREGQPIVVDRIELRGFDVLGQGDVDTLKQTLPLIVDKPLDSQLAVATRERALNALRDHGYPYAEVTLAQNDLGNRRRAVVLTATPGILAHFGPVEIVGTKSVSARVVERQLTYKPGDVFTRQEMRESQRKIYGLELFQFANVTTQEDKDAMPALVPTRVTVAEGKHRKFTFGVGYGSEEKARATIRWDNLNTFHGAQNLGVEAKWSSLSRGVRLNYTEPYFLWSHFSLRFEGQAWQSVEPVYSSKQLGGRVILRHQANSRTFWSVSFINEYHQSTITSAALADLTLRNRFIALGLDPRTGTSRGTLSGLAFDITRTTTNNVLDAHRGYMLTAHAEQSGRFMGGSYNYVSFTGEGRHYATLFQKAVLANRLHFGIIDPSGAADANVPFYKRYFLGGASSIRGWGRYEVSPLSGLGLPIGGYSLLEGSSEVRFGIRGKVGGVAFVDYGNVWEKPYQFNLSDLKVAVGPGLRYLTPIGPARLDFGYQLTTEPGLLVNGKPEQRHWRIHFSIGQAF